jgi:hypothetical protein
LAEDYGLRCVLPSLAIYVWLTSRLGNLLLKRLLIAVTQANTSKSDFVKFDHSLREENEEEVKKWETDLAAWAEDNTLPDSYRLPKSSK